MNDTLFELPVCESPRLKWLRTNDVKTLLNKDVKPGDECEITGETLYPWCAYVGQNLFPKPDNMMGCGDTEHDAIVALAIKRGLKLWNEE